MPGLLGVGNVDRYEVRGLEQLLKLYVFGIVLLFNLRAYAVTVVVDHVHAAGLGAACKGLTYTSHAQDTQCLASQRIAQIGQKCPFQCSGNAQTAVHIGDAACYCQHQAESQIGRRFGYGTGGIGYCNSQFGGGGYIDVVKSYGVVAYQFKAGQTPFHELAVNREVEHGLQDVILRNHFVNLIVSEGFTAFRGECDIVFLYKFGISRTEHVICYKNAFLHTIIIWMQRYSFISENFSYICILAIFKKTYETITANYCCTVCICILFRKQGFGKVRDQ